MMRISDKLLLLSGCGILYYFAQNSLFMLIPLGIVAIISALGTIFHIPHITFAGYLLYLGSCCFFPLFSIFVPVLIYDLQFTIYKWSIFLCVLPYLLFWDSFSAIIAVFSILFFAVSIMLYYKTSYIEVLQKDYDTFRATSRELAFVQEEKNKSILANQDYEIKTATLNERNRISKEIHDHIGHLLSRSLLQIGALLTITHEEPVKEGLCDLKASISEGMDSIRASIHNMHDESVDLEGSIYKLVKGFTFCPLDFRYQLHSVPILEIKYCFIAITKESLANIQKHSNAAQVSIELTENESQYSMSIEDNGTIPVKTALLMQKCQARGEYPEGLGLQSMHDRMKCLGGTFTIDTSRGFKITVKIPKEVMNHESALN